MYPILIELGPIKLYSYGVMLGLSCVLGAHLAVYLAARSGIPERKGWWFALSIIVVGLLGGRLHDVAINATSLGDFFDELFKVQHAGRTAYGAFLAGSIAGVVASRVLKVSLWAFMDAAAPASILGLGLTRIGCFLWGCDYGVRSDAWGVRFPANSPAWDDQVRAGELASTATASLPVFPIMLVESAVGFALGAFLLWAWFRRPRRVGTIALGFFGLYGVARALLEVWRADSGRGELLGMSTSMAIGLFTAGPAALLVFVPPLARLRPEAGSVLPPPSGEDDAPKEAA